MIRFPRLVAVLVLLAGAAPASAFTRETTDRGNPGSGKWLWWRSRQVTFQVNAGAVTHTGCQTATNAEATIANALATWGAAQSAGVACTDFSFAHGAPTTQTALGDDGVNLIVVRNKRCADVATGTNCNMSVPGDCGSKLNCWEHDIGTIGLTSTFFDSGTGELHGADMELFAWDGASPPYGAYFTCADPAAARCPSDPRNVGASTPAGCNWTDLGAVATHEAGHMLGLDHVCTTEWGASSPYGACPAGSPVMAPTVGDVALRVLAQDDVSGVCTIYPKGAATSASPGVDTSGKSGGSSGGGGCNTGGGAGILALLGAAAAAWRARRRGR